MYSDIEKQTKKIYIEQHKNYLKDTSIFDRHRKAAQDLDTYDLPATFFNNIRVLDAGCGNTGYFQVAMYNLGVKHVTRLDIGVDWMPELKKVLAANRIPDDFCSFVEGTTLQIPSDDENYDLVCSNGVIMHLETPEMSAAAIKELVRVCKKVDRCSLTSASTSPASSTVTSLKVCDRPMPRTRNSRRLLTT